MKIIKDMSHFKKELLDWIKTISISLLIGYFISHGLIVNAKIPTGSMESTIMTNDRVIANRLAYISTQPKRGDIIVFKFPDDESQLYVKRVIGLPNEEILIHEGKVYVDGIVLSEEYLDVETRGEFGPYIVPENQYFMLGDNRNSSLDSRYWDHTFLPTENIIGKVLLKYYPHLESIK